MSVTGFSAYRFVMVISSSVLAWGRVRGDSANRRLGLSLNDTMALSDMQGERINSDAGHIAEASLPRTLSRARDSASGEFGGAL
ncbi:hypothetical protein TPA0906_32100 [Streptomyces olivaceus]|nr:hypothetical protein TPA0906_32100 [Streptomyces olivaceus]